MTFNEKLTAKMSKTIRKLRQTSELICINLAENMARAAACREERIVEKLNSLKNNGVDAVNLNGSTALMRSSDIRTIKFLIDNGASVNATGNYGNSELVLARTAEKAKLLIDAGANVNAKNEYGQTALMLEKNVEVVQTLISAGAIMDDVDMYGNTALMITNDINIARLLIEAGVNTKVEPEILYEFKLNFSQLYAHHIRAASSSKT